jgi:hypothetical protein
VSERPLSTAGFPSVAGSVVVRDTLSPDVRACRRRLVDGVAQTGSPTVMWCMWKARSIALSMLIGISYRGVRFRRIHVICCLAPSSTRRSGGQVSCRRKSHPGRYRPSWGSGRASGYVNYLRNPSRDDRGQRYLGGSLVRELIDDDWWARVERRELR